MNTFTLEQWATYVRSLENVIDQITWSNAETSDVRGSCVGCDGDPHWKVHKEECPIEAVRDPKNANRPYGQKWKWALRKYASELIKERLEKFTNQLITPTRITEMNYVAKGILKELNETHWKSTLYSAHQKYAPIDVSITPLGDEAPGLFTVHFSFGLPYEQTT